MANTVNSINIASEFIKKWEKLSSSSPSSNKYYKNADSIPSDTIVYAYYDSVGNVYTIGWGNTYYSDGSKVKQGDSFTKSDADSLILNILKKLEISIRSFIPYQSLNDNEYAAILSIAYNAGAGNLKASAIPQALNSSKSPQEVSKIIQDSIVTSNGKYVQSLKNRRIDESKLFLGQYNAIYSYYLRNSKTINYALIGGLFFIVCGGVAIWYYKKNKIG